jgi:uncharacterized Ntn-hydrolase superfamily protein
MTFSVLAKEGRDFGVAVASGSIGVGKRVPWAERGVGAVATQGFTRASYGPKILKLLREGMNPCECIEEALKGDPDREFRQILVLGDEGGAAHSGRNCPSFCGHAVGENFVCGGNLLASRKVLDAMVQGFQGETLAVRLLSSLTAGAKAGGDRRGQRSAALLLTGSPPIRLEVEDSRDPVSELWRRLERIIPKV